MDAQILHDAARFKMDLVGGLERTLQGKIKPSRLNVARFNRNHAPDDQTVVT